MEQNKVDRTFIGTLGPISDPLANEERCVSGTHCGSLFGNYPAPDRTALAHRCAAHSARVNGFAPSWMHCSGVWYKEDSKR